MTCYQRCKFHLSRWLSAVLGFFRIRMAMAGAPDCAFARLKAFPELEAKCSSFGARMVPTRRPQSLVIRSSTNSSSIVALLDLAAAPAKKSYVTVTIAAVVVPLAMAAAAVAGGFLLKRRIRNQAMKDAEEFRRLVEGGMDPEEANALVIKRIDEEFDSPPVSLRRRRGRRGDQQTEAVEAAPAATQAVNVEEQQVRDQHEQPT